MASEVPAARPFIQPYLDGTVVDIACGRTKVCPHAIGVDWDTFYQRGQMATVADTNCAWGAFVDAATSIKLTVDTVFSSHLLEDYADPWIALELWLGLVKPGGHLVLLLPVEAQYKAECARRGDKTNGKHQQDWAGADDFVAGLPEPLAKMVVDKRDGVGAYSFLVVLRKPER